MHPNVSNFIIQALKGEPVTIYGDGSQTHSFCYIDDMVEALMLLMKTSDEVSGPMNLGNSKEYSVLELAHHITNLAKSRPKIHLQPLPQDDPQRRKPDITMAKEVLRWSPKVKLEEGLPKTIEYFDNLLRSQA